jgi:hypothetical protein
MKPFRILILLIFIIASCAHKKKEAVVIISELEKERNQMKEQYHGNPEPIPFNQKHNFILTGDDRVFYFENKNFIKHTCGDVKIDYSNPEFLGLMPSDLHEIEIDSLMTKLIVISKKEKHEKYLKINIASECDTIRNKSLSTFEKFFHSMRKDSFAVCYQYRLITEEESLALNSKLHNIRYNPDSVQWKKKLGGIEIIFE